MSGVAVEPAKRLYQVARRCLEKVHELETRIFTTHTEVVTDRRHYERGTAERGYYTAGYLQALKDIRDLIDHGEFPEGRLDSDGGPRIRRSEFPLPGE